MGDLKTVDNGHGGTMMMGQGLGFFNAGAWGAMGDAWTPATKPIDDVLDKYVQPDATGLGPLEESYASTADIQSGAWKPKEFDVGSLDTAEDRLRVLNQLTQNTSGMTIDGSASSSGACGASTILAAAIHAGGAEGIQTVIKALKAGMPKGDEFGPQQMAGIEQAMKDGNLNSDHLKTLQDELYFQMRERQAKMHGQDFNQKNPGGLDPDVLKSFIAGSDDMKKYFEDHDMAISSVDTDNKDGANHFVLNVGGAGGFVFDPFAQKNGSQLFFDPNNVANYRAHEDVGDRIDANDF